MTTQRIKLYALSTCSHCKAVKELLTHHNADFEYVDVDRLDRDQRKTAIEEVKRYNERLSFPTTVIGEHVVVGYKADQIKKTLQDD
jgi:glutaredoxin